MSVFNLQAGNYKIFIQALNMAQVSLKVVANNVSPQWRIVGHGMYYS